MQVEIVRFIPVLLLLFCLIFPGWLSSLVPLDPGWLLNNQLNLVSTAGTMASISLAILSMPLIRPEIGVLYRLWIRFGVLVSILSFLLASLMGLAYQVASPVALCHICF
ncbi:MAG TPA: hypothetical protein EYP55_05875 [Anaerolineae bacterium]|nr:hypothetical protein [Anaerolineae bacterium]